MARFDPARLTALRDAAGLSREDLAMATGRPTATIERLERNEVRPSLTLQGDLALALRCPLRALYSGDGEPDLRGDETLPTDLGPGVDAWIRENRRNAPPMSEETARRVSAAMFPQAAHSAVARGAA
jgi:transcriptional regulator with XRE-family HTH domain